MFYSLKILVQSGIKVATGEGAGGDETHFFVITKKRPINIKFKTHHDLYLVSVRCSHFNNGIKITVQSA